MTIDIEELREGVDNHGTEWITVYEFRCVLDRLEAAEKERDALRALGGILRSEISELRAKIAEMEKQEPHSYIYRYWNPLDGSPVWRHEPGTWNGQQPGACAPLYALPGAQGE